MTAQQSEFNKQSRALDRAYEQASLNAVLLDVRHHDPAVNVSEAWVYETMPGTWEFHFGVRFLWYIKCANATEARAAGWSAWLTKEGVEGYAR